MLPFRTSERILYMKKKIAWIPAIILMILIFYFSNQSANVSANLSGGISYRIVTFINSAINLEWTEENILFIAEKIDYPVRKLAHLTEYALLGMAISLGGIYGNDWFNYRLRKQHILVQTLGSLYAISDEFHQLFVIGRAGRVSDVLIDSVGVLIGFFIFIKILVFTKEGGILCQQKNLTQE